MNTRAMVCAVVASAGMASAPALGQYALGTGQQMGRGMTTSSVARYGAAVGAYQELANRYNSVNSFNNELAFRNSLITGNAPNGLSFRGNVGYLAAGDFLGRLPSNDLFSYRRDSLYSGFAGMGIRGTDALQYQFALTTGATAPPALTGNLSVNRNGYTPQVPVTPAPLGTSAYAPIATLPGATQPLSRPDASSALADQRGQGLWTMRSTSAFNSTRSIEPSLLQIKPTDKGAPLGIVASTLRGVGLDVLDPMTLREGLAPMPPEGTAEPDDPTSKGYIDQSAPSTELLTGPKMPGDKPDGKDATKSAFDDMFKGPEDPLKSAPDPTKDDPFKKTEPTDPFAPTKAPDAGSGQTPFGQPATAPAARPNTAPGAVPGAAAGGNAPGAPRQQPPQIHTAYEDLIQRLQKYDKTLPPALPAQTPGAAPKPDDQAGKPQDKPGAAPGEKPAAQPQSPDDALAHMFDAPDPGGAKVTPADPVGKPGRDEGPAKKDAETMSMESSQTLLDESWKRRLIEIRSKLAAQPVILGGAPDQAQPGTLPTVPTDGMQTVYTSETMKLLRMTSAAPSVREFAMAGFDAYSHHMRVATEFMAAGRFFDAEERFTTALSARPGDPMARIGRVHSQIGGGMLSSALVNLRLLFVEAPEVVTLRYDPSLMPKAARLDGATERLRRLINDPKNPNPEMGLLLAYLGWQRGSPEVVVEGIEAFDLTSPGENAADPDVQQRHRLAVLLREVWTKPADVPEMPAAPAPAADPAAPAPVPAGAAQGVPEK